MFPKFFYYTVDSEQAIYSFSPQGQLDINRLLNGQAYWKTNKLETQAIKKTLIFSDWQFNQRTKEQQIAVEKTLNALLESGFTIYEMIHGNLALLTPERIGSLYARMARDAILPGQTTNLIHRAAEQLDVPTEQLVILDDYWLQRLQNNSDEPRYELRISDLYVQYYYRDIMEALKESKEAPSRIILDSFFNHATTITNELLALFPQTPVVTAVSQLILEHNDIAKLTKNGRLSKRGHLFYLSEMATLDSLRIITEVNTLTLEKLLSPITELKTLHLDNATQLQEPLSQAVNLAKLTTLKINAGDFNSVWLTQMLAKTVLTELCLTQCSNFTDDSLSTIDGSKLESLTINACALTTQGLQNLLNNTPKLKVLNLEKCANVNLDFLATIDLSQLERLNLSAANLSTTNLEKLLSRTPKLQSLTLSNASQLGNIPPLPACHTLKLVNPQINDEASMPQDASHFEVINIRGGSISGKYAKKLLNSTSKLTNLGVFDCKKFTDEPLETSLKTLTVLLFEGNNIEQDNTVISKHLKPLLDNNSSLQRLVLNYMLLDDNLFSTMDGNNIQSLQLSVCEGNCDSVRQVLNKTPHLKELILNLESMELTIPLLHELIHLSLMYSPITAKQLQRMLVQLPHLRELNISECEELPEDITSLLYHDNLKLLKKTFNIRTSAEYRDAIRNIILEKVPTLEIPHRTGESSDIYISGESFDSDEGQFTPHNAEDMRNFTPTPANEPFVFRGNNKTLNQGMILEKLCHYLTLTKQHQTLVHKIQDGICFSLAKWFSETPIKQWKNNIQAIADWDGNLHSLTEKQKKLFHLITEKINKYQFNYHTERHFLGDNVWQFLKTTRPKMCVLGNPWHAIAVKYDAQQHRWYLYDPEAPGGVEKCTDEELPHLLKESLGPLIDHISNDTRHTTNCKIDDANSFLEEGGLLSLHKSANKDQILQTLPPFKQLSKQALAGLLLRDMDGIPAWLVTLSETYGFDLLKEFIRQNLSDYKEQLQHSLAALSTEKRFNYLQKLINADHDDSDKKIVEEITEILRATKQADGSLAALQTWKKKADYIESMDFYCQQRIGGPNKQLIELKNPTTLNTVSLSLQEYCQCTSRPVFYIHSPEELVCSANFLKEGIPSKGPGGPLHDFLMRHQHTDPPVVIVVNYAAFDAHDIVRFSDLLEDKRLADGTPVPVNAKIIGLTNSSDPSCYRGEDFYSRFDEVSACPLSQDTLQQAQQSLPILPAEDAPHTVAINLFNSPDWKARLLGKWILKEDKLVLQEGELAHALATGLPLEIHNGCWHDPDFTLFWQQALIYGHVNYQGRTIAIPPTLKFTVKSGYDWQSLSAGIHFSAKPEKNAYPLNPVCFEQFFEKHRLNGNKLDTLDGLIAEHQGKTLPVYLTNALHEDDWAKLLTQCAKYKVNVACYCPPALALPQALQEKRPTIETTHSGSVRNHTHIIESDDMDSTIAKIQAHNPGVQVIDVSECDTADLLVKLTANFNAESATFEFYQQDNALLRALAGKERIILKGRFSHALQDALSTLLLTRHNEAHCNGQLFIISEQATKDFHYLPVQKHHATASEKLTALRAHDVNEELIKSLSSEELEKKPLCYLRGKLRWQQMHLPGDSWSGLTTIEESLKLDAFDLSASAQRTNDFNNDRLVLLNTVLQTEPFVFLSGATGVGKTSFVLEELPKDGNKIYQGESQLQEWASSEEKGRKILFIDESNIGNQGWSIFEGLYNNPPAVLIDGVYTALSPEHKVIFAGNPLSYGSGRTLPSFFLRHGNAIVFKPMPAEFIYEKLLKPVFHNSVLQTQAESLSNVMLEAYRFICECSSEEVLISPREVQMMALLLLAHMRQFPNDDALMLAKHYAYSIGKHLLPDDKKAEFAKAFTTALPVANTDNIILGNGFLLTPSRQNAYQLLNDMLNLRMLRQQGDNDTQRYGGLGGILFEGEVSAGKRALVVQTLLQQGYQEAKPDAAKSFYTLPASMKPEERNRLLLKAFHEGAIVVLHGCNSLPPHTERLLNSLLMGKTPEGSRPTKPGFMLIGTQNPANKMAGRYQQSTALKRRLMTVTLPPYSTREMQDIVLDKGLDQEETTLLIDEFNKQAAIAAHNNYTPAPVFRDVLRIAQQKITAAARPKAQKVADMSDFLDQLDAFEQQTHALSGDAKKAAVKLCRKLRKYANDYICQYSADGDGKPTLHDYYYFKHQCITAIDRLRPQLNHQDWKGFFANAGLAIAGLGIFYGLALWIHEKQTHRQESKVYNTKERKGDYLFFSAEPVKLIDKMEDTINHLSQASDISNLEKKT